MGKDLRSLDDILQDVADVLFPGELVPPRIGLTTADCDGDTPLHVYLWRKDTFAVRTLVANGADVNAVGDMSETPLHVAVRDASADTIALLLAAGARENMVSEFEQTPLQLARSLKREAVYREAKNIARDLQRTNSGREGEA